MPRGLLVRSREADALHELVRGRDLVREPLAGEPPCVGQRVVAIKPGEAQLARFAEVALVRSRSGGSDDEDRCVGESAQALLDEREGLPSPRGGRHLVQPVQQQERWLPLEHRGELVSGERYVGEADARDEEIEEPDPRSVRRAPPGERAQRHEEWEPRHRRLTPPGCLRLGEHVVEHALRCGVERVAMGGEAVRTMDLRELLDEGGLSLTRPSDHHVSARRFPDATVAAHQKPPDGEPGLRLVDEDVQRTAPPRLVVPALYGDVGEDTREPRLRRRVDRSPVEPGVSGVLQTVGEPLAKLARHRPRRARDVPATDGGAPGCELVTDIARESTATLPVSQQLPSIAPGV